MPTINKPKKANPRLGDNYDAERTKMYNNRQWRKLRITKLMDNPLCERCAERGIVRPAVDVHHITSFMSTNDPIQRHFLMYDYKNLMSLCKECHQQIHNTHGTPAH